MTQDILIVQIGRSFISVYINTNFIREIAALQISI